MLFSFSLTFAQSDIEERDDSFILLNNKNMFKINIEEPFYQVREKGCQNFESVRFNNGSLDFRKTLEDKMFRNLNSNLYVLNGRFYFVFNIDNQGKITDVEGFPKVDNSEYFFDDMKKMVSENKMQVIPAKCDGQNVDSKLKVNINLNSISSDL